MEGRTEGERRDVARLIGAEARRVAEWAKEWSVPPPPCSRALECIAPEVSLPNGWVGSSLDEEGEQRWVKGSWDHLPRGWRCPGARLPGATPLVRSDAAFVALSPCERFIFCLSEEADRAGALSVHQRADGAEVAAVDGVAPHTAPVWHPDGEAIYFTTADECGGSAVHITLSQLRLEAGVSRPRVTALFSATVPFSGIVVADLRCQHGVLHFRVGEALFACPLARGTPPFPVTPPRYSLGDEGASAEVAEPIGVVTRVRNVVDVLCDGEAWFCLQRDDQHAHGFHLGVLPMVPPPSPPPEDGASTLPSWQPLARTNDPLWSPRVECPAPGHLLLLGTHRGKQPRLHWLRKLAPGDADPTRGRAGDGEAGLSLAPEAEGWCVDPLPLPASAQHSQLLFAAAEGRCVPGGQGHHPALLTSRRQEAPEGLWRVRGPWEGEGEGRPHVAPLITPRSDEVASHREWWEVEARDGNTVDVLLTWDGPAPLRGRPALLEVYGCYATEPALGACDVARALVFDHGAVHAHACVRGEGGRNAEARGRHKALAARDVVDVARECWRVLQPTAMACMATSGGAMVAGAALNEDPSLFNAVLLQAAYLEAVRQQGAVDAPFSVQTRVEFGDALDGDEEEVEAVLALAPLRNVHRTVRYPPALVQQGQLDERTPCWEALKWVHTLRQHAVPGSGPFGVRVYPSLGHRLCENEEEAEACLGEAISFLASHVRPSTA